MRDVTYFPYSQDLSHPGDRRRLKVWSDFFQNSINLGNPKKSDLLVLSGASALGKWVKNHPGPTVIDLVDGYISYDVPLFEDVARNTLRSILGKSSLNSFRYSNEVINAICRASAVVVASPEQAAHVRPFNENVHCILDDHSELKSNVSSKRNSADRKFTVIWEGLGHTLKHLSQIAESLERFFYKEDVRLIVLTSPYFYRWANKFGRIEVPKLLEKSFNRNSNSVEFLAWSVENLKSAARISDLAILPIDLTDPFAVSKPENKLLSFWTLGLPTLCSAIPSYKRVLSAIGQDDFLVDYEDWFDALVRIKRQIQYSKEQTITKLENQQNYLYEFHSREIIAEKWDRVLTPLRNRTTS